MYARHRLDIAPADVAFAARSCLVPAERTRHAAPFGAGRPRGGEPLVCLSVRSGFDLLLTSMGYEPGSEVLVSAVTIPDMPRIAGAHGLVAVPVDLDPDSLAPRLDLLERAVTQRTRALLFAHLFGGRLDVAPLVAFARRHRLTLVEDCAQAFDGSRDLGHPEADVSMFSFGPIKTATALGGALLRVSDPALREGMARVQATWPVQSRRAYAGRVAKYAGLATVQRPLPYRALARGCGLSGRSLDSVVARAARGFPYADDAGLLRALRQRPSAPLVEVLAERLASFDHARLCLRARTGERIAGELGPRIRVAGAAQARHTHWVFPVVAPDPPALVRALSEAGFDATQISSMVAVAAPPGRPETDPVEARRWLARVVYLPAYPEMPEEARARMVAVVRAVADPQGGDPRPC